MKKILIIAPHPDDETLGCGGTILKHSSIGDKVYWMILTNISEQFGWDENLVAQRQKEVEKVAEAYGFESTYKLDFPTTKLDEIPMGELVDSISKAINEVEPHTIYMQNRSDVHSDHKIGFQAAYSCTKNFRYSFIKRILMYETLSETEFTPSLNENSFTPNVFVDISDFFEEKVKIIKIYASELMNSPFPRSIEALESLAIYRGSRIGRKYAEGFVLLEEII